MSLTANISNLATAIGTDVKATNAKIGNLGSLTTTAKGDLVAAVNEVKSSISGAGASINDAVTNTSSVWSSSKTNSAISAAVTALVNSSPAALDTLKELSDALGGDAAFAATMTTALGNRVRYDAAQTLTGPQQAQARANIGASNVVIGTTANTAADAELVGDTNTDFVAAYNTAKA